MGFLDKAFSVFSHNDSAKAASKEGSLRWYGHHVVKELLSAGKTVEQVSDISWLTALAGVGVVVSLVSIGSALSVHETLTPLLSLPKSCSFSSPPIIKIFGGRCRISLRPTMRNRIRRFDST